MIQPESAQFWYFSMFIARSWFNCILYPRSTKGGREYTGFTLTSVCPSVDKVSATFCKKQQQKTNYLLNAFHTWYMYLSSWGNLWTPIHFHVPSINFGPLVAKYLAENEVSGEPFWNTVCPIRLIFGILPNLVESLDPYSFSCSCRQFRLCGGHIFDRFLEYFWRRRVVIIAGVYCSHLWLQLVCFALRNCC